MIEASELPAPLLLCFAQKDFKPRNENNPYDTERPEADWASQRDAPASWRRRFNRPVRLQPGGTVSRRGESLASCHRRKTS